MSVLHKKIRQARNTVEMINDHYWQARNLEVETFGHIYTTDEKMEYVRWRGLLRIIGSEAQNTLEALEHLADMDAPARFYFRRFATIGRLLGQSALALDKCKRIANSELVSRASGAREDKGTAGQKD